MKQPIGKLFVVLAVFAGIYQADGAPAFTITPAAISNTYAGSVTLQISGLTAGDTVVVQKFLDLNTNGVIDASDYLVQQFNLTDGQAGMVINGVTNINVPGDTDGAANGQITAQLDFPSFDFVQSAIGQYLFRLSSPVGHFTSIVKSFSVTNFPYAQSFAGNVVSNGTSTTLPNAVVLLFPPPDGQDLGHPVALAVADNSGHYTIPAPAAGTYLLFAAKSNFVASLATPTVVALAAGATVITNLSLFRRRKAFPANMWMRTIPALNCRVFSLERDRKSIP